MQFSSTSYNELFNQAAKKLAQRAGINNFGSGSKASALIDTFIDDKKKDIYQIQNILSTFNINEATGKELEAIGSRVGVFRQTETRAATRANDKNFAFYVDTGTFGDINNGSSFVIPAGEIVYLEAKNNTTGKKVEYAVKTNITCSAGSSIAYGYIEAVEFGSYSNVAKNTLVKHNFTSYTLSSQNKLKCKNNYSIVNGRDRQTDNAYRNLISKAYIAWATANESSLRYAARSIAGVKEVKVIKSYAGLGTVGVIVDSYEGKINNTILDIVSSQLTNITSSGEKVFVYAPKYIGIQLNLVIKTNTALNDTAKLATSNLIKSIIKDYIAELKLGDLLDLSSLYAYIVSNVNTVTKIGRRSNVNSAESIYLYYYDNFDNYSIKELVTNIISVDEDQKIILMEDLEEAITLTIES